MKKIILFIVLTAGAVLFATMNANSNVAAISEIKEGYCDGTPNETCRVTVLLPGDIVVTGESRGWFVVQF